MIASMDGEVTRAAETTVKAEVIRSKRLVRAIINDGSLDRYNSVIDPNGCDATSFRANPVCLWMHGLDTIRGSVPIGRTVELELDKFQGKPCIVSGVRFREDAFSNELFEGYASGDLRAWSIRVRGVEAGQPTRAEIARMPELKNNRPNETRSFDGPLMIRRWELMEISAVAVPGNSGCLTLSVERGAGVTYTPGPRARNLQLLRDLGPEVVDDLTMKKLEQLSDAELASLINRLQLEHKGHTWQHVVGSHREHLQAKAHYAAQNQKRSAPDVSPEIASQIVSDLADRNAMICGEVLDETAAMIREALGPPPAPAPSLSLPAPKALAKAPATRSSAGRPCYMRRIGSTFRVLDATGNTLSEHRDEASALARMGAR